MSRPALARPSSAKLPPEPMPRMPSVGWITSPVPETSSVCWASMTAIIASKRRSARSVRHSLASSVAARGMLAG